MNSISKIIGLNALLALILVILFDAAMFFALPDKYAIRIGDYRTSYTNRPDEFGGVGRPKDYYVVNAERGVDIGENRNSRHWVEGLTYPIWSNSIGCFDIEHSAYNQYVYFAGDSMTWGVAPFDQKFGTIVERVTGVQILKCGVAHTGQLHQFSKFVDIVKEIGASPKAVFVFHFTNDIANDFAHPHTTVIEGWPVDNVYLDLNDKIEKISRPELEKKFYDKKRAYESKINKGWGWYDATRTLKNYSLTINIVAYYKHYLTYKLGVKKPPRDSSSKPKEKERTFYETPNERNGRYWVTDNPFAKKNKEALIDFKNYSERNKIRYSVVLIPKKRHFRDTNYYEDMRKFLDQNEIEYIDLSFSFADQKFSAKDLYWMTDGHLNPSGNRIISEILVNEYPDIFLSP